VTDETTFSKFDMGNNREKPLNNKVKNIAINNKEF
jgi:hypothetical protein